MTTYSLLILISSLISGAIGLFFFSNYLTEKSQVKDNVTFYYQMVIERRLNAYEQVTSLLGYFKANEIYENNESGQQKVENIFIEIMSFSLWLSESLLDKISELKTLVESHRVSTSSNEGLGVKKMSRIDALMNQIENVRVDDLNNLGDVKKFLIAKHNRFNIPGVSRTV